MKRYIAVLLALVCLLTPLANTKGVFAVTYSTAEYEDIISTLMGEASTFEENFNNVQEQQGIYTQLYQARQIFGYATCVYGAAYSAQKDDAYRKQIGGSLGMLAVTLSDMIVSYNASYFVSEGEYKGEAFSQCSGETSVLKNLEAASDDAIQKACEVLEEWCIAVAKTYLVQTVEKYADDVELDNEDMQEENSSLCSEIYKALKYGLTCISDVESVLGQQNEQTLSLKGYTFKKSTVEERIKADIEKYAELFGTGLINVAIDDESDNMPAMKLYFSIALLLLGVIAENMLSKSIKLRDTTLARIGFVINIALLAIVVAPAAGMWIVTHAISLFNKVDSFNAVQWFENVHW